MPENENVLSLFLYLAKAIKENEQNDDERVDYFLEIGAIITQTHLNHSVNEKMKKEESCKWLFLISVI